ncbi:MAG: GMC family oxidoreductase [Deltaproteobacteria bacterium]|nr:GMC family oxidoreductase [Deltaproteobacteria bacterium]
MTPSEADRATLLAVATAALPAGRALECADAETVRRAIDVVARAGDAALTAWLGLARLLDTLARTTKRAPYAALPLGERLALLQGWAEGAATRHLLRALLAPLKLGYFDDERVYRALGMRFAPEAPASNERQRWSERIADAATVPAGETLECDAVVVGTGAGGGPVAKELAERGLAVIVLEEGKHHDRKALGGRPTAMMASLYRSAGFTAALGNHVIPIPLGKTVGGTTTINSGTALRPPERVLASWAARHGADVSLRSLEPYFERVEEIMGVGESSAAALGKPAELVARGADALGWSHHALARNAPGCDGQGLCCFGCPTEAKRSSNVSFMPAALRAGAQLYTSAKVTRVLVEDGEAKGVEVARTDGARFTVRARVVVLACGSVHTPALLLREGMANTSGQLGRNLTIHPATSAIALFDDVVDGHVAVPQGYAVDQFAAEGLMFEGATAPLELTAVALTSFGPGFMEALGQYRKHLSFGFMIADSSTGRVRPGRGGEPLITYRLRDADVQRLRRGMALLGRLFFAAGAREMHAAVHGFERMRSQADVDRLAAAPLSARSFDLTAYHPLGTARIGADPRTSVVANTHECHDVLNLYIVDGGNVQGPLYVNPQVTIMALATRAAEHIARRVERLDALSAA